ncbi:MAG: hypothetical protein P1P88_08095 [Bacteroidales bacterium]|nr:hypothetical protein [Bacteroidales bacterium]
MKTVLIMLALQLSNFVFSQSSSNVIDRRGIVGHWDLPYNSKPQKELVFEKAKEGEMRWGKYLVLFEDGELTVGYSAPCGNDNNRFRDSGTWTYNTKSRKITFSIDVHGRGKVFYVKKASIEKLILI